MEDVDLELDEMELVAAAAGYYYYKSLRSPRSLSYKESDFVSEILSSSDDVSREMLRMDKHVFQKFCDVLRQRNLLRDTSGMMIEEQFAIFLNIVGHNERNRVIQERFRHSGETISRHFNRVLKAVKSLSPEFFETPRLDALPEIHNSNRFYPYFKDCLGVIDGMHVPANVPAKDQPRFRNNNGFVSQNVLAACTFDLQFMFVYPGWEGSATNSRVLQAVLGDPDQNFPQIPEGKYYLVDSGYSNMQGFIAPFPGVRYHIGDFRGANNIPQSAQELFNHRHSCLANAVRKSFSVLKQRFPILKLAPQYAFHIQRDLVIATCVLHNFIRREERNDWLFANVGERISEEAKDVPDEPAVQLNNSMHEHISISLRDYIASTMWNDFLNCWDEW